MLLVESASEHVIQNIVFKTSFDEFVLRQHTVAVGVHLGEDLPRSRVRRITKALRVWFHYQVDRLYK